MENLNEKLSRLSIASDEEERIQILGSLKSLLMTGEKLHPGTLESLNLNAIFDCFNTSNEDEILLASESLRGLLDLLNPSFILEKYSVALLRGLSHPHSAVKICVLKTLQKSVINETSLSQLLSKDELLSRMTLAIADEDLTVVKEATAVISSLANTPKVDSIFSAPIFPSLEQILSAESDVVKFRVYDIIIQISTLSEELLRRCSDSGIIGKLTREVFNDDILVQLNALEVLTDLAKTPQGFRFLVHESGIVPKLDQYFEQAASEPMAGFLLPGLIKFFGNLAYVNPRQILSDHPNFASAMFANSEDLNLKGICFETVGIIGTTSEGKLVLKANFDMNSFFRNLSGFLRSGGGGSELRVKALNAFANLIISDDNDNVEEISREWFEKLGDGTKKPPISYLAELVKRPFTDCQDPAYRILVSISSKLWGQELVANEPGFLEFLLNRDNAKCHDIKEYRYKVIVNLVSRPNPVQLYGTQNVIRMKEYVKEGPFFVKAQSRVAYQES